MRRNLNFILRAGESLSRVFSKEVEKPDIFFGKHDAQCVQMMDWDRGSGNQERFCKDLEWFTEYKENFKTTSCGKWK